ncbi:hypothetical protein SAMN06295987_101696 [Novosphingobium mathurense]|uniref:Uncharacterized protein n=1 Tax=Novosphingobium mathurense TaxID=428990 RepID=A0A1U6GWF7_9SPHN|nr:hypothetical protein SAMN06295987_101696 [Novosphingobium mathurense]
MRYRDPRRLNPRLRNPGSAVPKTCSGSVFFLGAATRGDQCHAVARSSRAASSNLDGLLSILKDLASSAMAVSRWAAATGTSNWSSSTSMSSSAGMSPAAQVFLFNSATSVERGTCLADLNDAEARTVEALFRVVRLLCQMAPIRILIHRDLRVDYSKPSKLKQYILQCSISEQIVRGRSVSLLTSNLR